MARHRGPGPADHPPFQPARWPAHRPAPAPARPLAHRVSGRWWRHRRPDAWRTSSRLL